MGPIFISYSHKDTKYAHGLADHLKTMGFETWIDERVDYGSQWPHELQKQLDTCDAFILVMTPRSFTSDWVQSELQRAKRKWQMSWHSGRIARSRRVRGTGDLRRHR